MARQTVDHYIPFFGRDFLAATAGWTAEERGHYVTALIVQWEQGSIPDSLERLEIISPGITRTWALLESKFPVCRDGRRRNPRMEIHRAKSEALKEARVEAGRAGGEANQANRKQTGKQNVSKMQANGVANGVAKLKPPTPTPTPSPPQEKQCSAHTRNGEACFPVQGEAEDAWEPFVRSWNATNRACPWTPLVPPAAWGDFATSDGWLGRAEQALERLPACEWFDTPVALTKFFEYVDRILAGEFDNPKQGRRARQPAGGNL
jgi:hypothetical protein